MTTSQTPPKSDLDIVLDKLYLAIKDSVSTKANDFCITWSDQNPEDLGDVMKIFEFLEKQKVIKGCEIVRQGEYDVEIEMGIGPEGDRDVATIFYLKLVCNLKPKTLVQFLIETARIPKYILTLDKQRRLVLNYVYILSTPHFNSSNFYFIDYVLKHPKEIIKKEDVEKTAGKIQKRFHTILRQIIKEPNLIKVFFPQIAANAVEFRNGVKINDLVGQKVNEKKIESFLKNLRKVARA